jgi:hypothetical protein
MLADWSYHRVVILYSDPGRPSRGRNMTPPNSPPLSSGTANVAGRYMYKASWAPVTYWVPDDEDRDGTLNVGFVDT